MQEKKVVVLDVRNDYEWDAGHFVGAGGDCCIPQCKQRRFELILVVHIQYMTSIKLCICGCPTCCGSPCRAPPRGGVLRDPCG
jgi:hypothetical protein